MLFASLQNSVPRFDTMLVGCDKLSHISTVWRPLEIQVFCLMLIALLPRERASQILRCFHGRDRDDLCKAFVVYVRPVI